MKLVPNKFGSLDQVDEETGEVILTPFFKTPYNHDRDAESARVGLLCKDKSLTDQSFREETDINTIMERAMRTGQIPVALPEHFMDATNFPTLLEARTAIAENNATFYKLSPEIRAEFQNAPELWEVQIKKDLMAGNIENLERMGIDIDKESLPQPPTASQGGTPAPGPLETVVPNGTPVKAPSGG